MKQNKDDRINIEMEIQLPREETFKRFITGLNSWWPKEYTWSGQVLEEIKIEPETGGKCYETGPYNFRCDWGRVMTYEAPDKLVITWQISPARVPEPDPGKASEITVLFKELEPEVTGVEFEHGKLSKHGEGWEEYYDAMKSEQGWPYILNKFREYCGRNNG